MILFDTGIYKLTHKDSGKIYIGQSKHLKRRLNEHRRCEKSDDKKGSQSVVRRAIKKYSFDAFDFEILLYCQEGEYMDLMETKLIQSYDCLVPKGYNVRDGGNKVFMSEEGRKRVSKANSGRLVSEETTKDEIEFEKKNYYLLDAQRYFEDNSFDFVIQTIGQFENKQLVKKACNILQRKFADMIHSLESDTVPITMSETTIENSYDVILENEDYTMGKVIEYLLYEKFYMGEQLFSFCGFKKLHPHDSSSKIRIAYKLPTDKHMLRQHLKMICISAMEVFEKINKMF